MTKPKAMTRFRQDDHFQSEFRAKLYASQVDSGLSIPQLADKLGLKPTGLLSDYLEGKVEMPVTFLHRYAKVVSRPIWWFFGEQPTNITIESAQNALTNVSRMRLYLDAVEAEFKSVISAPEEASYEDAEESQQSSQHPRPVVVDFAPYLARARAILEQEAECTEDSEEVFEESVELIAQRLYSIEMAAVPSREMMISPSQG